MGHESVDPALVGTYESGGAGPDKHNLRFDMASGPKSQWNRAVLMILMKKLKKACKESRLRVPDRSEAYYLDILTDRYKRARSAWRRAQLKVTEADALETPAEVEERLLKSKEIQLRQARTRERRAAVRVFRLSQGLDTDNAQKYDRRIGVVCEVIDIKEQEDAVDVDSWKWLKSMLEYLSQDGMSSEDSDDDDNDLEITYRPRILSWRRDIEQELKIIDGEYERIARTQNRRGAKPARRKRDARNSVSERDPVCGLPYAFYNREWLLTRTDRFIKQYLKLSTEKFKWKSLAVA